MKIKERTNEVIKLDKEMLNVVTGGCWFGGRFGTHHGMSDLSIDLWDGIYSMFTCEDCGKVFYMFKDNTGKSHEISKAEFEAKFYG